MTLCNSKRLTFRKWIKRKRIDLFSPLARCANRAAVLSHSGNMAVGVVKVVSSGGTVYLSGTVNSLDARQRAIKTASDAPGVQSVVNSLVVQNERRCRRNPARSN
jgi:hypothetical protein